MRVNAAGPLAGVGSGIAAVTAKGNTSRSPVPFPVPLASVPVPPLPGIAGDGTEWQDRPGVISVHSVNSVFALPSRLHGPPVSAMASVVPVSVSCVTAPKLRLFAPLAPVCQVSPLCLDQFQLELLNHPDRSVVNYVLSGIQHGFRIGFDTSAVTLNVRHLICGPLPNTPQSLIRICKLKCLWAGWPVLFPLLHSHPFILVALG